MKQETSTGKVPYSDDDGSRKRTDKSNEREYDTLGRLALSIYEFAEKGLRKDTTVYDRVNDEKVPAEKYFRLYGAGDLLSVQQERLPADLDVKGAYVPLRGKYRGKPVLELSKIDFSRLEEELVNQQSKLPQQERATLKGRSVYLEKENIIATRTINTAARGHGLRIISSVRLLADYRGEISPSVDASLRTLDIIYNQDCMNRDEGLTRRLDEILKKEDQSHLKGPKLPKLELRLSLELKQILQGEQRLALIQTVTPQIVTRAEVLQSTQMELIDKIKDTSEELDTVYETMLPGLRKKSIARIRSIYPDLSWKRASDIYFALLRKGKITESGETKA